MPSASHDGKDRLVVSTAEIDERQRVAHWAPTGRLARSVPKGHVLSVAKLPAAA